MTETILLAIVLIFIAIQTAINIWAINRINDMRCIDGENKMKMDEALDVIRAYLK